MGLLLTVLLSGCVESETRYVLNSDGSGKVHFKMERIFMINPMTGRFDPELELQHQVRTILTQSKGVDVWSDVEYAFTDEGQFYFSGTAYFKNFNNLKLNEGASDSPYTSKKGNENMYRYVLSMEGEDIRLSMEVEENILPEPLKEKLSAEDLENRAKYIRALFHQTWRLMEISNRDSYQETRFFLPGTPVYTEGVDLDEGTGEWVNILKGNELMDGIEEFIDRPAYWQKRAGLAGVAQELAMPTGAEMSQILANQGPLPDVRMRGPFKNAFDYESEVAAAAPRFKELKALLRIPPEPRLAAPSENANVLKVDVAGTRFVRHWNPVSQMTPFKGAKGYELSILVTMDGAILHVDDAKVTHAYTTERIKLAALPQSRRGANTIKKSADHSQFLFHTLMESPPLRTRGLDEIRGEFSVITASKSKTITLGILDYKEGARLDKYQTRIFNLKTKEENGENIESFDIELRLHAYGLKELSFYNEAGEKLILKKVPRMLSPRIGTYRYSSASPLPDKIRVDMEGYLDLKKQRVPFVIRKVDLLGRPLQN